MIGTLRNVWEMSQCQREKGKQGWGKGRRRGRNEGGTDSHAWKA